MRRWPSRLRCTCDTLVSGSDQIGLLQRASPSAQTLPPRASFSSHQRRILPAHFLRALCAALTAAATRCHADGSLRPRWRRVVILPRTQRAIMVPRSALSSASVGRDVARMVCGPIADVRSPFCAFISGRASGAFALARVYIVAASTAARLYHATPACCSAMRACLLLRGGTFHGSLRVRQAACFRNRRQATSMRTCRASWHDACVCALAWRWRRSAWRIGSLCCRIRRYLARPHQRSALHAGRPHWTAAHQRRAGGAILACAHARSTSTAARSRSRLHEHFG